MSFDFEIQPRGDRAIIRIWPKDEAARKFKQEAKKQNIVASEDLTDGSYTIWTVRNSA